MIIIDISLRGVMQKITRLEAVTQKKLFNFKGHDHNLSQN